MMRTHRCGDLRAEHAGQKVALAGWVHHLRDHKGVVFADLRDTAGEVQVVFHPDESPDAAAAAQELQRESCVLVHGEVVLRPEGMRNDRLSTGDVEVRATGLEVLSESATPPFPIEDALETDENLRLKHRYLDLRRPRMQRNLRLRAQVAKEIRAYLDERGFVEVETPILFKSTPEGARDFLVPSRLSPGEFYALPQSPQILKQLLMVAGLDRYYQIPRCFRDEDLRADRQLEFTQLDLEMSFVEHDDVLELTEGLYAHLWRTCLGIDLPTPFPRIPYEEAIRRFGTDHVDMRYGMELADVHEVFAGTSLGIFKKVVESGGAIRAIAVPGGAEMTSKELKRLEARAKERGAKGLAWVAYKPDGSIDSPLANHLSDEERRGLAEATGAGAGDLVLLAADKRSVANEVLGSVRMIVAEERGLIPDGVWAFCWIVDYPFFERNEDTGGWDPIHHPFTRPADGWEDLIESDPGAVKALAYDIVLNGNELASGSIRIHRPEDQARIFRALGIDDDTARERFGFLLDAFRFGPPPHGGIAPGIDRTVMLMAGEDNIREVIAFPKTQSGGDPMSGAPSAVDPAQLRELGLGLKGS